MRLFIKLFITLSILSFVQAAIAEVVMLADDKTATLDLTSKEGAAVDLFECGIYVLEENGNTYLVPSKGKLPIPKSAVHIWPDGEITEIETTGALLGLRLASVLLPYSRNAMKRSNPYKFKEISSQPGGDADKSTTFFVAERESIITKTIKKKLPKTRLIPTSELEHGNEMILLNPAYLHPAGGYPLSEYLFNERLRKQPLIQIDYNCGVRQDTRNNPYFKKQNETFRFGQ